MARPRLLESRRPPRLQPPRPPPHPRQRVPRHHPQTRPPPCPRDHPRRPPTRPLRPRPPPRPPRPPNLLPTRRQLPPPPPLVAPPRPATPRLHPLPRSKSHRRNLPQNRGKLGRQDGPTRRLNACRAPHSPEKLHFLLATARKKARNSSWSRWKLLCTPTTRITAPNSRATARASSRSPAAKAQSMSTSPDDLLARSRAHDVAQFFWAAAVPVSLPTRRRWARLVVDGSLTSRVRANARASSTRPAAR